MNLIRSKLFVFLAFCLISVGQAYPYAAAYAHTKEHHQCACNKSGRACIHGCGLKKRKAMKAHQGAHAHHGHGNVAVTESRDPQGPQIISPACSRQNHGKIFGFDGEPFVLVPFTEFIGNSYDQEVLANLSPPKGWILACDAPPPKEEEPPQNPS